MSQFQLHNSLLVAANGLGIFALEVVGLAYCRQHKPLRMGVTLMLIAAQQSFERVDVMLGPIALLLHAIAQRDGHFGT